MGLRRFCRDARFLMAEVKDIDLKARRVRYSLKGQDAESEAAYDHLVLSMGTVTLKPPVPGLKEHGYEIKSLVDAITLRDRAVQLLEHANAIDDAELRRELLTVTIVGGSFTGVEVAGEFQQYMREAAKQYPQLKPDDVRVVILNRGDQLLKALDPKLGEYTLKHLRRRGITVKLNTEAKTIHATTVELSDGEHLPARTVVWAAGIAPNPSVKFFDVPTDQRGYILCERDLRVKGYADAWGIGDAAVNPDAKGEAYPATAQSAVQQAKICARNIVRVLEGEETEEANFGDKGQLAAFGRGDAVAQVFGQTITGWPAWFLWRTVYLMKMPGFGRKLRVAADWTLDLFTRRDFVELGIHRAEVEATGENDDASS